MRGDLFCQDVDVFLDLVRVLVKRLIRRAVSPSGLLRFLLFFPAPVAFSGFVVLDYFGPVDGSVFPLFFCGLK